MKSDPLLRLKLFGGLLLSVFILTFARSIAEKLYPIEQDKTALVYSIGKNATQQSSSDNQIGGKSAQDTSKPVDLATRLNQADANLGKRLAVKCRTCHSLKKNGSIKIGPPLWGIIDSPSGAFFGFNYSTALKQKNAYWSAENMDQFLTNPQEYIPGTKMRFAGISNPQERADLIRYLETLHSSNGSRR